MHKLMSTLVKPVSLVLVWSTLALGFSTAVSSANLVSTRAVLSHEQAQQDRAKVLAFMDRAEVRRQLEQFGVNGADAKARVAALSDAQVHQLAGKISQLPAGGDIIGAVVFVFIVLLITDILGFTDVFPFVKKHVRVTSER